MVRYETVQSMIMIYIDAILMHNGSGLALALIYQELAWNTWQKPA